MILAAIRGRMLLNSDLAPSFGRLLLAELLSCVHVGLNPSKGIPWGKLNKSIILRSRKVLSKYWWFYCSCNFRSGFKNPLTMWLHDRLKSIDAHTQVRTFQVLPTLPYTQWRLSIDLTVVFQAVLLIQKTVYWAASITLHDLDTRDWRWDNNLRVSNYLKCRCLFSCQEFIIPELGSWITIISYLIYFRLSVTSWLRQLSRFFKIFLLQGRRWFSQFMPRILGVTVMQMSFEGFH